MIAAQTVMGQSRTDRDRCGAALAYQRVLVARPGALGDTLLVAPALARLRQAQPQAELTYWGNEPAAGLLRQLGLVDRVVSFEHLALVPLFIGAGSMRGPGAASRIGRLLNRPEAAVLWLRRSDDVQQALAALNCPTVVSTPSLPPGARTDGTVEPGTTPSHVAVYLVQTLDTWLGPRSGRALPLSRLVPTAEAQAWATGLWRRLGLSDDQPVVVLHPGSGSARKNWPVERFASVATLLAAQDVVTLLIAGPADVTAAARVAALAGESVRRVPPATLDEIAALLGRCRAYLGNDSGITHLAALTGTPTVAIFGPTDPTVWRPLGQHARVVRAAGQGDAAWPTVEEVGEAVLLALDCGAAPPDGPKPHG